MTRQQVLLAAFVGIESAHFFSAFLPSRYTIRTFAAGPDAVAALRDGERLAVLFSVGLGAVVGALAETPWPLIAAVLTAAAMTAVYEADIRRVEEAAA